VVSALMPKESEAHGLAALLEFQASRTAVRTDASGEPVLLKDQNRRRWNRMLIARGAAALGRAEAAADGTESLAELLRFSDEGRGGSVLHDLAHSAAHAVSRRARVRVLPDRTIVRLPGTGTLRATARPGASTRGAQSASSVRP
jgi:hypothetical protein